MLIRLHLAVAIVVHAGAAPAGQRIFDNLVHGDTRSAVAHFESGGDPEIRDTDGISLLHWVTWSGEAGNARSLQDRGMDVNVTNPSGTTPLMYASRSGHLETVGLLPDASADANAENENGLTPLRGAAAESRPETLALLLSRGAAVNTGTKPVCTYLHYAAGTNGTPDVFVPLLDGRADPLARANDRGDEQDGFLPLVVARKRNPALLDTDAARRLQRLTYEGTGCEGVIVPATDTKLSILAERTLGKGSRWKAVAKLNDFDGRGYSKAIAWRCCRAGDHGP